jgi:4-hydroxyphenylpyruvate dioxygenase-like putative hemolysin
MIVFEKFIKCVINKPRRDKMAKGIKVGEITQVAVVVKDLKKAMENYWKTLGMGPWQIYTFAPPALRETTVRGKQVHYTMKLAITWIGSVMFELIEPLEGPSIYKEFLKKKGEGLHHIACYKVDDVKKTLDTFRQMGIEVLQSGKFDEVEYYYMDTEPILGIIYETGKLGKMRPPEATYPPEQ